MISLNGSMTHLIPIEDSTVRMTWNKNTYSNLNPNQQNQLNQLSEFPNGLKRRSAASLKFIATRMINYY